MPDGPPDDRFVYLSDVLPTAWQAVEYADVPDGGSVAVLGLGPIGDMAARIAQHRGAGQVIGVDLVPERLARARAPRRRDARPRARSTTTSATSSAELTDGRGPDAVIDAVGMEAHGSPLGAACAQKLVGLLPDAIAAPADGRRGASTGSRRCTRRSTSCAAAARSRSSASTAAMLDPMPMMTMFDKQIQLRMGQANVKRWIDDILPLLTDDDDPLGVDDFATHHLPLERGAARLRDLPEEAGRRGQDPAPAVSQPSVPVAVCGAPTGLDSGEPRWRR